MLARATHRRCPVARTIAWLRRARDHAQNSGNNDHQDRFGEVFGGEVDPDFQGRRHSPDGQGPPLLPCHLPPRPRCLQPDAAPVARSRRRAKRWQSRALVWELTEAQVGAFVSWELNCPKSPKELRAALGEWKSSPHQQAAFHDLLSESLRLCRPFRKRKSACVWTRPGHLQRAIVPL